MPSATMTSKGQITIPKAVREELGLEVGDKVAFRVLDNGTVVFEPETADLRELKGVLKPRRGGITVEHMNQAIRDAATGR